VLDAVKVNERAILSLNGIFTVFTTKRPLYSGSATLVITISEPSSSPKIPFLRVTDTVVEGVTPSPENI
jgi:hypothetical protein